MRPRSVFLSALRSSGVTRRVLAAYTLFGQVEIAAGTAVVMWAYSVGGASLAGLVMVVWLRVSSALLSPVLVGWGDRRSRGTSLAVAHAVLACFVVLTLVALVGDAPIAAVVAASSGITILSATVRPLHYSVLPSIARSADELVSANALSSSAEQRAFLIGPVVAGVSVQLSGAGLAMAVCAALAVVAALLCVRLGVATSPIGPEGATPTLRAALGGLSALRERLAGALAAADHDDRFRHQRELSTSSRWRWSPGPSGSSRPPPGSCSARPVSAAWSVPAWHRLRPVVADSSARSPPPGRRGVCSSPVRRCSRRSCP